MFLLNATVAVANEDTKRLSSDPQWIALLHLKANVPQVNDSSFILSHQSFDPHQELLLTLQLINDHPIEAMCRFPARYTFLDENLPLKFNYKNISLNCPELKKFVELVPFDKLSLIFASEKLASVTSMMGHVFLNASGQNVNGTSVSHSIAFYTDVDTTNPLQLIYKGLISGMNGLLVVKPFEGESIKYSQQEGRNIWTYNLDISKSDKKLIQYHLWELKSLKIDYLFQSYNCATLTLDILSIVNLDIKREQQLFVSPIDVVKAVKKYNMISSESVLLTTSWKLKMLHQEMSLALTNSATAWFFKQRTIDLNLLNNNDKLLIKEYISLLLKFPHNTNKLSSKHLANIRQWVNDNDDSSFEIDLSNYKSPTLSKQDSIIGSKLSRVDGNHNSLELSFLPASHHLYGDNSQYFSESSLKIGEFSIRQTEQRNFKLDKFSLYDITAYTPSTRELPLYSGSFYVGYHHIYDENLASKGVFEIAGSFGRTTRLNADLIYFTMFGGGVGFNREDAYGFLAPKVGIIVNVVGNTKLVIDHSISIGRVNSDKLNHSSSITYAWNGLKETTINFSFSSDKSSKRRLNEISFGIDFHF